MTKKTLQLNKWLTKFGKDYTDRNSLSLAEINKLYKHRYGFSRVEMNEMFLGTMDRNIKILEVGSNIGIQLQILQKMRFKNLYGIEPLNYAVELSKKLTKEINIIQGNAFDIPFKDNYFDLVFTSGVLIHISPKDIKKVIKEIYRCTKKYIWGFEYYSKDYEEIPYRDQMQLLWRANFPQIYIENLPCLKIIKMTKFRYLKENKEDIMFLLEKHEKTT